MALDLALVALVLGLATAGSDSRLTIQRRQIDPERLVVVHLAASGDVSLLELAPGGEDVHEVRATRAAGAERWIARLESAGFFDWPESSLAPPPELDVESDPLRVELRRGGRARLLATQAPYTPADLQAAADSLLALGRRGERLEGCVVCIPRRARGPIPEAMADSVAALREIVVALPFPVALPGARGEALLRRLGPRFPLRAPQGTFEIECKRWPR